MTEASYRPPPPARTHVRRTPAVSRTNTNAAAESRSRWGTVLLVAAAAVIVAVPVDFVSVGSFWRYLGLASLVLGSAVAVWTVHRADTSIIEPALIFGFLVLSFNQLMNFNPVGFVTLLAPVVVGAGVAVALRNPLVVLVSLSVVFAGTMGIEFLLQEHIFGSLFGEPHYTAFSRDTFRARGLIGQAVPAGMIAVGIGAAALVLSRALTSHRVTVRWVVVTSTTISVLTSGTRSAMLCAGVLLAVSVLVGLYRKKQRRIAIGPQLAWLGPLLLAVVVTLAVLYWTVLSSQRVFSFGSLEGSASLDNRNYAGLVFQDWTETCSGACVVFGSGARSLLDTLANGLGFRGFTTVDNLFLSLLWDFGIVMVLGLLVLVYLAIRAVVRSDSMQARAGGVLILAIMVSGFFYDALYIRPVLLLCGFGIGLLGKKVVDS